MAGRSFGAALAAAFVVLSGCVSVDYVGQSYTPTSAVDLYFSPDDVKRPYTVMGEVTAQMEVLPFQSTGQQLQQKLMEEARRRGANGMIVGSMSTREVAATQQTSGQEQWKKQGKKSKGTYTETTTTSTEEQAELRGTLIRYE
ncbi:MAG: hypothetical protein KIT14_22895 [bacterium]|nr:hypothetical protein [bacterium]